MDQSTLEHLRNILGKDKETCAINNLKNNCVTFIRSEEYLSYLINIDFKVFVISPGLSELRKNFPNNIIFYETEYPEYEFTIYHNYIHETPKYRNLEIGLIEPKCNIHETALIGEDGLKVVNTPDGRKIPFIHSGSVLIKQNTNIGAYSIIHRGTMDKTIISEGCNLGVYTNIGHNCFIGKNNTFAAGVILSGGVKTGENCWFGSGSIIKHHINICDNVVIGTGAVVVKDIVDSGIYVGNPAKFLKPITEGWNF